MADRPEFILNGEPYLIVPKRDFTSIDTEQLCQLLAIPSLLSVTFGYLLRSHRTQQGLTQTQLANDVGTTQKHIDKIENCKIRAPQKDLELKLRVRLGSRFGDALDVFQKNWKP